MDLGLPPVGRGAFSGETRSALQRSCKRGWSRATLRDVERIRNYLDGPRVISTWLRSDE